MAKHWLLTKRGITRSVGVRFALVVLVLQVVVTSAVVVLVERTMWSNFERDQKATVFRFRDTLRSEFQVRGAEGLATLVNERVSDKYSSDIAVLLLAPNRKIIAGNLRAWPLAMPLQASWHRKTIRRIGAKHEQYMGFTTTQLPGNYILLSGAVVDTADRFAEMHKNTLALAVAISVPFAIVISIFAAWMVGRQLRHVGIAADALRRGDFSVRLPVSGSGDGFDLIAKLANVSIARTEAMVGELRLLSGGLAHDLRSPITRLRGTLERSLTQTDDDDARRALEKALAETDTLLAMLVTTLQISNAQANTSRDRFTLTDIGAILDDLVEIYGPSAEDSGFSIKAEAPAGLLVMLHRDLIVQALSSLIENALKYAAGGTAIMITAEESNDMLRLLISDNGIGIPEHRYDDARRRYGRLDASRHVPGSGLGLALVDAVARLHGGTMSFENNAPGLSILLTIPMTAD